MVGDLGTEDLQEGKLGQEALLWRRGLGEGGIFVILEDTPLCIF